MKLILCLLVSLNIFIKAYTQDANFLTKYSYMCYSIEGSNIHIGTCFFYRFKSKTYLITAYHVIYGIDAVNSKNSFPVDTFKVIYYSKSGKRNTYPIYVGKNYVEIFSHLNRPDIVCIEIKVPKDFGINFINNFVKNAMFNSLPDTIYSCGYPITHQTYLGGDRITNNFYLSTGKYLNHIKLDQGTEESILFKKNKSTENPEWEFGVSCYLEGGYSGAPAYGKFYKNGKPQYYLIGLMVASNPTLGLSLGVNASYIYNQIINY